MIKTNAMRILEKADIPFDTKEYEVDENDLSGEHIANQLGLDCQQVFKTLVAKGDKNGIMVFCIPVNEELDFKKASALTKDKKIEMVHVKELLGLTGYIRGGCSPIGMKKKFPTYLDETIILFDFIYVSAGIRGAQIIIKPDDLIAFTQAQTANLVK
ncbi:Cys-tRNA(Pro)/Cys-tRNA(Cys) deacylase [Lachnotalea glycerini]|uniref:Cys-tRNA(Pro)/Cys-tRNA(Cys) deacylase n=1 Tax=Lachnotalea glycerini TaxID=1763509 RepID=A0A255M6D9_9FIRM|nr:Cys-tRNA(Pro) deacylase [Lachnotalea glycerini]OYO84451.1 Cys-tRNA(Pro) deacylase [Lachnotalea glycerini]PXV90269.1 Cys-tRNA(Pro)/Cys-tRNA(Cys) deacylase [Lachnotalea glycerini]RDY31023.1 Cys-tRNA(Pro) deacylase [Lachnotalea glycerini]